LTRAPGRRHAAGVQHATDIRIVGADLWYLPVTTRMPLKFGSESLTKVVCARARVLVKGRDGRKVHGWGETPLSVPWTWPSALPYAPREEALKLFTGLLTRAFAHHDMAGHPLEIGEQFLEAVLPGVWKAFAPEGCGGESLPWLAALVCASPLDQALHDAYGVLHGVSTYDTYRLQFLNRTLEDFIEPADGDPAGCFDGKCPSDFLAPQPKQRLLAWHLVGGFDPLLRSDLGADAPNDGLPAALEDWIEADGLRALKIKLRGVDYDWDLARLKAVAAVGLSRGVEQFSADFNCTVDDPAYVCGMLDQLASEAPEFYARLAYVEQPFEYELSRRMLDVREISRRKPLFLDESAHGWREVRLGLQLGWSGVALKTCKTQTGALLSLSWARAHGMPVMVQDLTNPMLAMIPHALLASHAGTLAGVETNACQFYPAASGPEAEIHPGLYRRLNGEIDLTGLPRLGLGVRDAAARRNLGEPHLSFGACL
jgi:L-alanine-DL-glutamate epimerase-like enolase superfamily enzyme